MVAGEDAVFPFFFFLLSHSLKSTKRPYIPMVKEQ